MRTAHRLLAYVPADVALWPQLTGAETLELLGRTGPGVDRAYRDELVERFDLDLSKPARTYSTGNRQKVALIAAFATRAPLLVLDEPTSGLDPLMEREFRRAVAQARDNGQTVFLCSHQLAEVEAVCDRVGDPARRPARRRRHGADLRRLHRAEVLVTFTGPAPDLQRPRRESTSSSARAVRRLRFALTGPPGPALRALAAADVTTLTMREPTLEEIFLDYYGEIGPVTAARRTATRPVRTVAVGTGPPSSGSPSGRCAAGALIVLAVISGMSALVVTTYASIVGDGLDAAALAALAREPGDPDPVR